MATTEDADAESDETFTVGLSVSGTTLPVTATDTATGTITNQEPPPGKPDAPAVTVHSSTSLSVSWTAPGGATVTDYNVRYRAGTSGDFTDAGYDGTGTSTTLYGLAQETLYEVQVQASNGGATSPWSEPGTATTPRFTATLSVWDASIAEVGDTTGGFQIDFNNIPQGPGYPNLCFRLHHLHNRPGRHIPNSARFGVDFVGDKVQAIGGAWNNDFFVSRTRAGFYMPNPGRSTTMWVHIRANDDFFDDDNEEVRIELERVDGNRCRGNIAGIRGNPKSIYIQDDDPGYSLTATSEQGGDTNITEGKDADDQATITLTVNKVQDGVTAARAAYTWSVNGQSPADGVTAASGGQALGASGAIDIPISGNQGSGTIAVTAAADGDAHNEAAVFTLTGITFTGPGGAGIDDLSSLSDTVNIQVFDATSAPEPVAVDDRLTVAKGGTATALVGGATSVRVNDSDSDTPTNQLTVALGSGPQHMLTDGFTLNADGTFSYTHDGSSNHADSFTYTVKDADDRTSNAATVTIAVSTPPVITDPGDKTFARSQTIPAFAIAVADAEETPEVTLTGLPAGLAYDGGQGQVSGTVHPEATLGAHTVTITADDGVNAPVTEDFTITVTTPAAEVTVADASASEGETITFTVTLDKAVSGGFTVTPSFEDVTAAEGTDYTANTAALTFTGTAGETKTFTVATTEDADAEPDETFIVNLLVSGAATDVAATDTATGTITNDDGALATVTIEDASAAEGEQITFTVTLDRAVSGGLTVTPGFTDVTATEGTDYTANTAAITFAGTAGETQTFTVATTEDADAEVDETFAVSLAVSGTQAPVSATDTATGTITNDDGALATVTIENAAAAEGEQITFTVTLDEAVSGGLTVTPSFTDGTATKGTDYTENTVALTFAGTAGETQTFAVATTEDADAEVDETFTVSLTVSGTQTTVGATDTATGTITNDDGAVAAVTIEDAAADEGEAITFTVTLDQAVAGGLTVTPSFDDVTATEGTDYTANTAAISFAGTAGETQTFTVVTTEDADAEPDETFTVRLSVSGTSLPVTTADTATGTITDDDAAPAVTIADASAEEGEAITFTVTLDKAVPGGLTVTPSFTDVTATKGTDYTENTAALRFAGTKGEMQTFTVATTADTDEENETFTVSLSVSGTAETVTATDTATGTIIDDYGAKLVIVDAWAVESNEMTLAVVLTKAVSGGLTVTPSFTDVTATKGADYTENTAAMIFAGTRGEAQTFVVATTEDADIEPDETFTVGLSVSGTSETVAALTATGTILDDDGAPAVTIDGASADEGEPLAFTVTLDKPVWGGFTVTPSFTDGTTTKGADYTENTAAVAFTGTRGETQTFMVQTTDDADEEDDETFTVRLTVLGTSETVTATDTATGTINDDDAARQRVMRSVTIDDAVAAEGDPLTLTVTLSEALAGGLTVTPSFTDGTAIKGADYTENTAALTFAGAAGETQTFTVATTEDADEEDDETFTVGLTVSWLSETATATDTATATITDDDDGGPAVTIADAGVTEGDSLSFTVTLDEAVSGGLTVTPSFTDGTATEGTDYTANTAALTFAGTAGETRTFTVATTEDDDAELDETFMVGLRVSGTSAAVTATDTATGTIINDDGALPAVRIADASATEGDALTFTVTLDEAVAGGLTVTPSFTDGTATEGTDYTANTAALTFAGNAGETHTFAVATTEDAEAELEETFAVGLIVSGTETTVVATDTATGRIVDDDVPPIVLRAEPSRVVESAGPTTVEVTAAIEGGASLSRAIPVHVTVGAADDAARSGTDYVASPATFTVTIPAGSADGSSTFTLAPVNDTLLEEDEALTLSAASGSLPVTGTAVTLEDDDAASAHLVVRLEPDVVSESAGPTPVTVVAEIVGATPTAPVPVTVRVGDQSDSARLTEDYEPVDDFTILIPAGASEEVVTFVLSPIQDDLIEGNEILTVAGETSRVGAASDEGVILDADLAEVRSEGTGRTLFLLARAIGSEAVAAIEERFTSAGLGRRAQLGRLPTYGPGAAAGWTGPSGGSAASFAGAGMPGAGPGGPAMAGAGPAQSMGSAVGPVGSVGAYGLGMGPGVDPGMPPPEQPFDTLAWLDGASFAAPLGRHQGPAETPADADGGEADWVIWGRAATTRTSVQATPEAQARGDLFTMHAGVDTRAGSHVLLGVAVSHSQGKMGYTLATFPGAEPAAVEGGLTSVQPYMQWTPRSGLELWGLGGVGGGQLRVSDTFGTVDTGIRLRLAAGGVRQDVGVGGLAVKADLFHAALASVAQIDLPEARATATRARLLLEWKSERVATESSRIRPRLELGGRWDGGTDIGGLGLEVGGGIALVHVGLGLELAGAGRYLLAHQAEGFEEWGGSVALRAGPGVTDRGPWVSVEPEWGAAASRMQAFWGPQVDPGLHPSAAVSGASGGQPGRLRLAAGYALPEAGADLRFEATRETHGVQAGPSHGVQAGPRLGFRVSATFDW